MEEYHALVHDTYEACYYLINNCRITSIESVCVNGKAVCQFNFSGAKLRELQHSYFTGSAEVNLYMFRRAYSQINSFMQEAKKKSKKELSEGSREVSHESL